MTASPYHRPPDSYEPPTRCEECGQSIMFGPVIGGHIWTHVAGKADHDVVMRPAGWWDTSTGGLRYGNGRDRLAHGVPEPGEAAG